MDQQISKKEKEAIANDLLSSNHDISDVSKPIFKVPFTLALELVKLRQAFISKGYAYISINDVKSVLCYIFERNLTKGLQVSLHQ